MVPSVTTDLDLDFLRERIADTVERAKANDPKALQREVARLKRELKTAENATSRSDEVDDRAD